MYIVEITFCLVEEHYALFQVPFLLPFFSQSLFFFSSPYFIASSISLSLLDHSPPDLLCPEHTNIFSMMSASCLA